MKTILPQWKGKPNIESEEHEGPARRASHPPRLSDVLPRWELAEMLEAHLTNLDSMLHGFGAARGRSLARKG